MIQAVDAAALKPAAYNPRQADEARLKMVELSLRKLGWLLPIYAAETDGELEILSGHQRHLVASERIGAKQVPVHLCEGFTLDDRRLVNIAFNRGTNDLNASDSCRTVSLDLERSNVAKMAAAFPDVDPDSPEAMPCLHTRMAPISDFVDSCTGRWSDHAARVSYLLDTKGIRMPAVVAGRRVINGVGRIQSAAERGDDVVEVVDIPEDRADLAEAFLNLLTMDFVIHERYADLLRYSNSRRFRATDRLNLCMLYAMQKVATRDFDPEDPANRRAWRRYYGDTVLDFGAGAGVDTKILREMGVDSTPFEPWAYKLGTPWEGPRENIDPDLSRVQVRAFLDRVRSTEWDTIFMASVMNSVPFDSDRRHLVKLIAALATPKTRVYPVAASYRNPVRRHVTGADYVNGAVSKLLYFPLDYEPRVTMTGFDVAAKTQRYFTAAEFYDLWAERFTKVRADVLNGLVRAWVKEPKPLRWDDLEDAIRFEFDLPLPDGSRLGLVDEAAEAFWERKKTLTTCITL